MSADVWQVNARYYSVDVAGGPFDVFADSDTEWYVAPAIGSEMFRNAGITNDSEADEFIRQNTRGPYGSPEEAIASLEVA